jgi:ATP-binding cassette subfamily B protein RaxB
VSSTSLSNRQSEASECGLACLAVAAGHAGSNIDLPWLRQHFPASIRGMTLREMSEVANAIGMTARAVRCDPDELHKLQRPVILHWGMQHFVVLDRIDRKGARVFDPSQGYVRLSRQELSLKFTGVALELAASPAFRRKVERPRFSATALIQWSGELKAGLAQAVLLSVLLQLYLIAMPLYMQTAIDSGALRGDHELLGSLAAGFLLFALFNAVAQGFRAVVLQRLNALLSWDMSRRLFHHLIRLPLPWFEKRKLADTMARFQAIEPIKNLISGGLVGALLDGVLSISMLILMFFYSTSLALLALGGFVLFVAVRLALLPLTLRYAANAFQASISEQGKRIETLRAIQTIKVMSGEAQREGVWANRQASLVKAQQANGLATGLLAAFQQLLETAITIIIVYVAARSVIAGEFTVGLLYAFISYRQQFTARANALLDQLINWRMLEVYNGRIADVVLTAPETGVEAAPSNLPQMNGRLELVGASFRYGQSEPLIFQNVSLDIAPGESVAIVGPSGCGKSTMVKAICGLYPLTSGDVRIDGLPLSIWGPKAIRSSIGAVMQNDELLPGSVLDNVTFFDEQPDVERAWECLRHAAVADEVRRLPMAEHSYVGDLGSALSGGQRQRILLARALYKQPRIIILDEATAHLDVERERRINDYMRSLAITRVIVAHRPDTIASADRVIAMTKSGAQEFGGGEDYRKFISDRAPLRAA